jgi:Holliday junction resolvase RusA-like endonuclease
MSFTPIDGIGFVQRTITKAKPIPMRRSRGVDMDNYSKSELDALLNAGPLGSPSATRVEREIQERRGGVLPRNWTLVKHYKANVDMIARMNLGNRN